MVIIGVVHSKGNYQGNDYDNINFQCFSDVNPKGLLAGSAVETVKVKSDVVIDCVGKSIKSIDWERFIGSDIVCQFNKFGQVTSFVVNFHDGGTADLETTSDGPDSNPAMSEVLANKDSKDNKDKSPKKSS